MARSIRQITAYLLLTTFAPAMLLSEGLHLLPGFGCYHCCSSVQTGSDLTGTGCGHPHNAYTDGNTGGSPSGLPAVQSASGENCPVCEFVSLCQSHALPEVPAWTLNAAGKFVPLPESFDILRQILSARSRAPPVSLA
ncbi:MAG: hypothetical protein LBH00_00790 [Planctomycetaceae bacterium]|jgi:hypothetical protein|nr:hypothetical protein [Planctomycetaceae bacterium]